MDEPPAGQSAPDLVKHEDWAANIVEKYNATARKLLTAQGEIQQVQTEQGRCLQELQKMETQNSELDKRQQKMIEELQKADKDMHAEIKKLMEERLDSTKTEVQQAVRALDEALRPKFDGLERGIEDVVGLQKDIQAKTLPRWKADLGAEIQSLRTDLTSLKEQTGARDKELADIQDKTKAETKDAQTNLESRLLAEINELKARLGKAEQAAEALASDHNATKSSLAGLITERAQDKAALDKRFESLEGIFIMKESYQDAAGKHGDRFEKLEKVTQQVLYDFEAIKSNVTSDLASKGEQLISKGKELDRRQDQMDALIKESLAAAKEEQRKRHEEQVEATNKKIAEKLGVVDECTKAAAKNAQDVSKVSELLEQKTKTLEQQIKQDAELVLQTIRSDETKRLGKLEGTASDVKASHEKHAEKQKEDHKVVTEKITSTQSVIDQKIKDVETNSTNRLKIIQQAVDELAQMFQEFGQLQQHQEVNLKSVQAIVEAVEIRLWPWKTRNRSNSPNSRPDFVRPISAGRGGPPRHGSGVSNRGLLDHDSGLNLTVSTDVPAPSEGNFAGTDKALLTGNSPARLRPLNRPRTATEGARVGGGYILGGPAARPASRAA
jgi:hypothetical protein